MHILKTDIVFPDFIRLRGPAGSCRLEWGETFGLCIKSVGDCQKYIVILVKSENSCQLISPLGRPIEQTKFILWIWGLCFLRNPFFLADGWKGSADQAGCMEFDCSFSSAWQKTN